MTSKREHVFFLAFYFLCSVAALTNERKGSLELVNPMVNIEHEYGNDINMRVDENEDTPTIIIMIMMIA